MRGGNDNAGVRTHIVRYKRDSRCGHGADKHDIDTHRADSGGEGALNHVAAESRVLADDDPVPSFVLSANVGGGSTDCEGHFGRHWPRVGHATNTIRSEKFSHVKLVSPFLYC